MIDKSLPQDNVTVYDTQVTARHHNFQARREYIIRRATTIIGGCIKQQIHNWWICWTKTVSIHQKANDSQEVLQAVANTVKFASHLLEKALRKGKVVIEQEKICGLLVSHTNPCCIGQPLQRWLLLFSLHQVKLKGYSKFRLTLLPQQKDSSLQDYIKAFLLLQYKYKQNYYR